MKNVVLATVLAIGATFLGCGSNDKASSLNGNWTAMLTDTGGTQVFAFNTSLVSRSDGSLDVTSFHFTSNSTCFASGETESGTFSLSGNFSGNVTGQFGMTIQSQNPSGNTLTLTGTIGGNTIAGKWVLAGTASGCTGSGNFTMNKS